MSPTKQKNPIAELSASLADAVETAGKSIVAIHARRRIPSSGVVWRDGIIVSASHTVRTDGDVAVSLPNGDSARATVVGRDAATDLVVLRLNGASTPVAQRADTDAARIGSLVLAVGRPGRKITASFGIVSAIADDWRGAAGGRIDRVLRLDLSIYDGFSGGPLVDSNGALIGIDNSALARGTPTALPASTVDRHRRRACSSADTFAGRSSASPYSRLRSTRLPSRGTSFRAMGDLSSFRSPMVHRPSRRGILIGDVLLSAGGQPLRRPTDLLDALSTVADGASLELEHLRGGVTAKSNVTPIDRGAREASEGDDQ